MNRCKEQQQEKMPNEIKISNTLFRVIEQFNMKKIELVDICRIFNSTNRRERTDNPLRKK